VEFEPLAGLRDEGEDQSGVAEVDTVFLGEFWEVEGGDDLGGLEGGVSEKEGQWSRDEDREEGDLPESYFRPAIARILGCVLALIYL
jgi:hypothetical protein